MLETSTLLINYQMVLQSTQDYQIVVMPFYRDQAAKVLQAFFKNPKNKIPRILLQEPTDNELFYQHIKQHITNNRYDLIDYTQTDFTRRLFGALRIGIITMHQMMTAKLMYESLICFHAGQMPKNPQACFRRYHLSDKKGPYQPARSMHLWNRQNEDELQTLEHDAVLNEQMHYYTFDIPLSLAVSYFSKKILAFSNDNDLEMIWSVFGNFVQLFLKEYDFQDLKNDFFEKKIDAYQLSKIVLSYATTKLSQSIQKDKSTGRFMHALQDTEEGIPFLCLSPSVFCFVLPTIETLLWLQDQQHHENSTLPIAVIGPVTTRMIRAYDEIPSITKVQTSMQKLLSTLYPITQKFKSAARPIELTHPDVECTIKPHGYHCHSLFLSWHDLLHSWRNSWSDKKLIRRCRRLHDKRGGFALNEDGMSKDIWRLVDMDFSLRFKFKFADLKTIANFMYILPFAGYDFNQNTDNNYLFLYDICRNSKAWSSVIEILRDAKRMQAVIDANNEEIYLHELSSILNALNNMMNLLSLHPYLTIVEIIIYDLLESFEPMLWHHFDFKTIFYWSKNNGVYFKKEYQNFLREKNITEFCLRKLSPDDLDCALRLIKNLHIIKSLDESASLISRNNTFEVSTSEQKRQHQALDLAQIKKPVVISSSILQKLGFIYNQNDKKPDLLTLDSCIYKSVC